MRARLRNRAALVLAGVALASWPNRAALAQSGEAGAANERAGIIARPAPGATPSPAPSYADLVSLLERAPLVLAVRIHKVAQVDAARAPDLPIGTARIYVEARELLALRGPDPAGGAPPADTLSYLVDVPLLGRGKLPALAKESVLVMARPVAGHPEMVQLVAPTAQLPWNAALEARVRGILAALAAPDAPSPVTGVREAIYVPGALVGEGETQIFLKTANGSPAAISVIHQPGSHQSGGDVSWSVSFSELADSSGSPPAHDTLTWYRLACFLPRALPEASNVSATAEDQAQARDDYRLVLTGLGACGRTG